MITPKKTVNALKRVKAMADKHDAMIVMASEMSRQDRELLMKTGWLRDIVQGWYLLTRPDIHPGDSASWYANFWDFLRVYLQERFGTDYCLSAEASLELHIGNSVTPKQVVVIVKEGGTVQQLPFDTSLLIYPDLKNLPKQKEIIQGLQVMSLPLALCKVSPTYYRKLSDNIEIALRSIRDPADLTRIIVENEFQSAAERIIGSYLFFGLEKEAGNIKRQLDLVGMQIYPKNPFEKTSPNLIATRFRSPSPYAARIELLWNKFRNPIIKLFPKEIGLPKNPKEYLRQVGELYVYDAYNSLSIEGYQVSEELIMRVQKKSWNPSLHPEDAKERNALAARGYYEAFQAVKQTLKKILKGNSPGECVEDDLSAWYQNLFSPSVQAEIISRETLFGFRRDRVFIRNSRHSPPPFEAVLDSMETFFNCLRKEESAAVRAILGHYIFVFIHPYMDGNGRIARFILNTMLASGGYPWSIVQVKRRNEYINALEAVHTTSDIKPFVCFIIEEMQLSKKLLKSLL
ncbi:MAG: hypothetical protein A3E82_03570 [Gammaproteobacteria bacterium RIFCSPHIGHO2_12_FULL_38_11]|nr:MAG: hypothetical protein A3E82_03570 [Gammaproteobacteria bacterium RIFCSPHIGHO2_12_FULL_38_11]